jgi:hypothetical protein
MFGFELINGPAADPARKDPREVLVPARSMMLAAGALLGLLVYAWAREVWGPAGGLVALFFHALSPTVLAHARLVTTDTFSAIGWAATLFALWRFTRRPSWPRAAVLGLALGLAILSKFSSVILAPVVGLLGLLWAFGPWDGDRPPRRKLLLAAGAAAGAAAIAYALLWACYGLRYRGSPEPDYEIDWAYLRLPDGPWKSLVDAARGWRLAPEAGLYGIAALPGGTKRRAFLDGKLSQDGWWYFLPAAFAYKTPPALVLAAGWAAAAGLWRTRGRSFAGWCLAAPALVYAGMSMWSRMSIGHRHLLPIEPILLVAAGGLAGPLAGRGLGRLAAAGLLAGYAVSFAAATPGYLSYFNVVAGGSSNGWRHLVDSSLDWGQDLYRLGSWQEENGVSPVHLAYFGTADPKAVGLAYRKVYMLPDFYPGEPSEAPPPGSHLAVSATILQGPYTPRDALFAQAIGRLRPELRGAVEEWSRIAGTPSAGPPGLAAWLVARGLLTEEERRRVDARLLHGWLESIRDTQEPVGRAGDSILIYRIP